MTGKQIKELRKYLGLTQTEFGRTIGRTLSTIQNWERGSTTPPKSALLSICEIFNIDEVWLNSGRGEMFSQGSYGEQSENVDYARVSALMQDDINELLALIQEYGTPKIVRQFIKKLQEIKKLHEEE